MTIAYRPAVQADEPWLFQLHEDAHRSLVESAYGPWVVEQQQQGFYRALVDDHQVLVIESGDEPIGALYLGERVHRVNERARRLYLRQGFTEISETETHHVLRSTPAT